MSAINAIFGTLSYSLGLMYNGHKTLKDQTQQSGNEVPLEDQSTVALKEVAEDKAPASTVRTITVNDDGWQRVLPLLDIPYIGTVPLVAGAGTYALLYFSSSEPNAITYWTNLAASSVGVLFGTINLLGYIFSKPVAPEVPASASSEETKQIKDTPIEPIAIL